ncbi:MAG: substrate-binding domain-containing protein [Erysipelotrichaceae bacterium]
MRKIITVFLAMLLTACVSPAKRPVFTLETYPKVDGSTVTIPLSEAICAALTKKTLDEVRPFIKHNTTHPAYLNLIDKKADLIFVTSPSADELKYAKEKGVELEVVPIVSEAFVFLVNAKNPVEALTLSQIQKIYTGEIKNWKEVGGEDQAIIAYQRPVNSGSQTGFLDLVMKGLKPMTPPMDQIPVGMGELIDIVASFDHQAAGIGYSYYYFVMDMWGDQNIKLMKVDGIYPDKTTISTKKYPITTAYYAVYRKDEKNGSDVRKIVKWLLGDEGQLLAEDAGYVKVR